MTLPACLLVCLSVRPSVCLSFGRSVCLSVCMYVCPSFCLPACPPARPRSRPAVCLSVCLLSVHLSVSLCLSVYLVDCLPGSSLFSYLQQKSPSIDSLPSLQAIPPHLLPHVPFPQAPLLSCFTQPLQSVQETSAQTPTTPRSVLACKARTNILSVASSPLPAVSCSPSFLLQLPSVFQMM